MGLTERALRELMRILETGKFPSDDSAASDLYFVVREALENRRTLSDRTAERDQLRAEVRSAKKKISVMGGEWMAEAKRAVAAEEKLSAATARAEVAESQLRAEVERLRGELEDALKASGANAKAWQDCVEESAIKRTHLMAEISLTEQRAEAAESTAAGLRRALEEIQEGLHAHCNEHDEECCRICLGEEITAALAASSDEHARRIKAEALREFAKSRDIEVVGNGDWYAGIAAERTATVDDLRDTADRLEKEATNGR